MILPDLLYWRNVQLSHINNNDIHVLNRFFLFGARDKEKRGRKTGDPVVLRDLLIDIIRKYSCLMHIFIAQVMTRVGHQLEGMESVDASPES